MDMTKEEKLARLNRWVNAFHAVDTQMNALEAVVGPLVESTLFDAVWNTFQAYTDAVSKLVGDECGWLDWYSCENDMGKKGLGASPDADTEPIVVDSTEKLLRMVMGCAE